MPAYSPLPRAEEYLLAEAILRHRPLGLAVLRSALRAAGKDGPREEQDLLYDYADSIAIDRVPDGFRCVSRGEVYLLGIGLRSYSSSKETRSCSPNARCGADTLAE